MHWRWPGRFNHTRASHSLCHQSKLPGALWPRKIVPCQPVDRRFIGTHLEETLRAGGQNGFVLLGLTTNHCVSTTVRMGGNLGFDVRLVGDACATFPRTAMDGEMFDADVVHRTALASLHGEFCTVIDSKDVLLEAS